MAQEVKRKLERLRWRGIRAPPGTARKSIREVLQKEINSRGKRGSALLCGFQVKKSRQRSAAQREDVEEKKGFDGGKRVRGALTKSGEKLTHASPLCHGKGGVQA